MVEAEKSYLETVRSFIVKMHLVREGKALQHPEYEAGPALFVLVGEAIFSRMHVDGLASFLVACGKVRDTYCVSPEALKCLSLIQVRILQSHGELQLAEAISNLEIL